MSQFDSSIPSQSGPADPQAAAGERPGPAEPRDGDRRQDAPADPQVAAREQAEVAAVLGEARGDRFDGTTDPETFAQTAQPGPLSPGQQPWSAPYDASAGAGSGPRPAAPDGVPRPRPAEPVGPAAGSPVAEPQHPAASPHQPSTPAGYGPPLGGYGPPPAQHDPYRVPPAPSGSVRAERRRPGWAALAGTAAAAAILASLGTAGFVGAFDQPAGTPASTAQVEQPQAAPVSATTKQADWEAVAAAVRESVVAIDVRTAAGEAAGSGVILDSAGHVLTNSHVVDGAQGGAVAVALSDGRLYKATIVGQDETTDLAVIALDDPPDDLVPATLGSSGDLVVGEPVAAVGNPLGLDSTVTTGIISALNRPVVTQGEGHDQTVVTNAIQVDAAVNPGNSGGPLFNPQGEVIGINSSIASLSGGGSQAGSIGLGFAIPVDQASDAADQLIDSGHVEHAFLGVALSDATATTDGVTRQGAEVQEVEQGSPAADAGLQNGDVITSIDGHGVDGPASLTGYVRQHSAGDQVKLTVVRGGSSDEVTATLAAREETSS